MNVSIYHNPRCSKSRTTLELLEEAGLKPKVILYLETPPSVEEMKQLLKMLGMKASELVRKKEAADANIDPSALDEDAMIAAMLRHPAMIERPIVVCDGKAALGRPPEQVLKIIPDL